MRQSFNADTRALARRALLNSEGAKRNLEEWILEHVTLRPGLRVLDLGCGTGKQLFALSEHILPGGTALGLDISAEAVDAVNTHAQELGLSHVSALQVELDDSVAALRGQRFDLILSTYAIYYSRDMLALLLDLRSLLAPGGTLFICGPGQGTNQEFLDMVADLTPEDGIAVSGIVDFIGSDELEAVAEMYAGHRVVRLSNPVEFSSPQAVLEWWRNHNSYVAERDSAVEGRVMEHFARESRFAITKEVLGLVLNA